MGTAEPDAPLLPQAVIAVIQRIIDEGYIIQSRHMKQRMRTRDFEMSDVLNVLEHGQMKRPPQRSREHRNWEYDIEGTDIEGESLTIRVSIDDGQEMLTLITGF